jgi:glycosyltransferase involved in cell wall biosynthesis
VARLSKPFIGHEHSAKLIVACTAPYGEGGLGQHFSHVVETARSEGILHRYYTPKPMAGDPAGETVTDRWMPWLIRYTPLRFNPGAINHFINERFDCAVAQRLDKPGDEDRTFIGFGGQSRHCFERAKALGYRRVELIAANSHVNNVARRHALALRDYPLEKSWLNSDQVRKTLEEYQLADVIHCGSEYTSQSFLAEGVAAEKLNRLHYPVDPRFVRPSQRPGDGLFRIVFTGSLTVMKGVPLLIEAFSTMTDPDMRLMLVGGSGTRGMHGYLRRALADDPRIHMTPGDPLPHLQKADVYVHPSYEDGFAYAPMEALACGVPVIVTEDTGMKEHVNEGVNGLVIPTGNVPAIVEHLKAIRHTLLMLG